MLQLRIRNRRLDRGIESATRTPKALLCARYPAFVLLCLLALHSHSALGQTPVEVKTAQELQDAVNAFSRYIHITEHLILTDLNAGTPNEGSLVFPDGAGDFAIWGNCDSDGLPYSVQVYNTAHGRGELGACSLHTETKSNTSTSELSALKFSDGRLYLSNIIVDTADTDASPDPKIAAILNKGKADFGISVQNAELWLVESVVAFFSGSNVKAVDSHVFFINSLTFQAGPLTAWNEGAVDYLLFADQGSNEHQLTLYAYNTIFHQDNLHVHGPVYVGPLVSNGSVSVVRGTSSNSLKSSPQIVFNMAFAHTHETTQPGCTGICICAPGTAQPFLYLNTTSETTRNYIALAPMVDTECSTTSATPSAQPFTAIEYSAVVPPGHDDWAKGLVAAKVPNADLLLDPTGGGGGSKSGISSGAIVGIVIAGIVILALLAALAACMWWRRRKARRAAAAKAAAADAEAPLGAYGPHAEDQFGTYAPDAKLPSLHGGPGAPGVYSEHRYYGDSMRPEYYVEGGPPSVPSSHASLASAHSAYAARPVTEDPFAAPVHYYPHSASTQHTRSSAGGSTLTNMERKTLGAVSAGGSQSAEGGATFESLTQKRVQVGGPVAVDFELLDSMLDEVDRQWGGVLLERYISRGSSKRSYGGQGAVQFATLKFNSEKKVAIKFFLSRSAFYTEQALYVNTSLHHILPPIDDVSGNEDGRYTDPLGRRFPPFVIMEQGQPLDEFSRRSKPDFPSCMQIIHHLIKRIAELHACGFTHRDLKPSNTIWLSSRNEWTIIDFGSTATIGSNAVLSVSLGYAAPETMKARVEKQNEVIADPAVDVWALGVMAIELLTGTPTYPRSPEINFEEQVIAKTINGEEFPWEVATEFATMRKRLGFMNDALLRMVARDPRERPTLKEVDAEWRKILQQGTLIETGKVE